MMRAARARRRPDISCQSASDSFPIARSNSSSLIARSVSSFSRSRAARVRCPTIAVRSSSGFTSGRTVRSAAIPTNAAVAISRPSRTTAMTPSPRATKVTAVAQPSAASTKNCQGWRLLVEVSELIVDALVERGVGRGRLGRRIVVLARPLHRREADGDGARAADQIREEPREAVEALVDRRAEHFLAAVLLHEPLDDLVVVLALLN